MRPIRDRWQRFIRTAYADVLTERVPDDLRKLLERVK